MNSKSWYFGFFDKPWKPFAIGVFLLVFVAFYDHATHPIIMHFMRDLGISFVLAAVIGGGIEAVASHERKKAVNEEEKRIKNNVLAAVVEKDVPRQWLDFVVELLRQTDFLRSDLRVEIDIQPLESKLLSGGAAGARPSFVLQTTKQSFKVKNVSRETKDYDVKVFIEKPWQSELFEFVKLTELVIDGIPLNEEAIKKADAAWAEDGNARRFLHKISMAPGQVVELRMAFQNPKNSIDSSTWASIVPSEDLQMEVSVAQGYRLMVAPKHVAVNRDPNLVKSMNGEKKQTFVIKEPIFPYTTVEVSWSSQAS